ncbi:MAG: hypothetical protein COZ69_16235 [Deltaproteobacteria bacterium CG_4_8_14_3_um_filter_45_9]|nr:MAG: hypothetical protein COZ69_16235 [Deltaproteobacteria bacterium CG_4_8_14_3_um_filter_45_9]
MVKDTKSSEGRLRINALSHHQQREYRGRGHIEGYVCSNRDKEEQEISERMAKGKHPQIRDG